ncbi:hypothetical protein D521_1425 [beta proteobacterium CB]|nr:hypothetical protein D521_1425 [beta proteobacterium CB]
MLSINSPKGCKKTMKRILSAWRAKLVNPPKNDQISAVFLG